IVRTADGARALVIVAGERRAQEVRGRERAAAITAPAHLVQVAAAHEGRVLARLIGTQMGYQAAIAERGGVAIDDKHASPKPSVRDHLPGAAVGVHVARQRRSLAIPPADVAGPDPAGARDGVSAGA